MLETDEIDQIISDLKSKIEKRSEKVIYLKYYIFLKDFNMKNRNHEKLDLIFKNLKKQKIIPCSKEDGELIELKYSSDLTKIPFDEKIYFKINESKEEVIDDVKADQINDKEIININSKSKTSVSYARKVDVAIGKNPKKLYIHQEEAIKKLDDKIIKANKYPFEGLLVIPTGGGKTYTAVQWLSRNYIDKNKKILWIAHRHMLLEQARDTFVKSAYTDILKNRKSFNYRIVSGLHDQAVNIKSTDDIIIASKDSLNSGKNYLIKNWLNNVDELFLVVDEAHHATAKSYRKLIKLLKEKVPKFRMLGLTATPFRTAEKEKGYLEKIFPDDLDYDVNLRTLIGRKILSEPIFEEEKTFIDLTKTLSDSDFEKLKKYDFDIDKLGKKTAKSIAENSLRNNRIVDHYIKNRNKYQQTLIFALNVDNAIALRKLFKEKGIACDAVFSPVHDAATGVTISGKENNYTIERFRKGDLQVLINVNIVTEGTDLPKIQTVFLTRPTMSTVLMTQMIGRGLRGEEADGTKNTYIVSFLDDWKDKIAWVNPERLLIEEDLGPIDDSTYKGKQIIHLISIEKIEEFAIMMDKSIDTSELENLEFIERIPVGLYLFSILKPSENDEETEKSCEVLIYDNIKQAYIDFINDLSEFFNINNLNEKEVIEENELVELCKIVEDKYFYWCEKLPGYRTEDIKDVLRYYALKEELPRFFEFKDRDKFDVTKIANEIIDQGLSEKDKKEKLSDIWDNDKLQWKAFFGFNNWKYFRNEVNLAIIRILDTEDSKTSTSEPIDTKELRELEKLSMADLYEKYPAYYRQLSDEVYEKSKDENGFYTSAESGEKSKSKRNFQIDHRTPLSQGGLTVLENLQILTRKENAIKGGRI
ncbi:MAG: DEAD/DEAH box helicase family protein [Euryarchaeota archaeon]|nr:DEAD/DEAH box helicase family protein [Euryarchaeota archaeon]MCG2738447.1 DEAD/DEAH box helicase family protein [Candidatus Methanoperedenaceae archaeon]